jgi:hypothetical protein
VTAPVNAICISERVAKHVAKIMSIFACCGPWDTMGTCELRARTRCYQYYQLGVGAGDLSSRAYKAATFRGGMVHPRVPRESVSVAVDMCTFVYAGHR